VTTAASTYFQSNESFASSITSAASSVVEYQSALNRYCATRKEATRGATAVGRRIEEVRLVMKSLKEKPVEVYTGSGDFTSAALLHSRTAQRVVASATEAAVAINNIGTMVRICNGLWGTSGNILFNRH
jgi:hypothetical protein